MIPEAIKTIIWDIVFIVLGYCMIYKIPSIVGLKKNHATVLKIVGVIIIILSTFNILHTII